MCNSYTITKSMIQDARRAGPLLEGEAAGKLIRPTLPGLVRLADTGEWMRWGFHRPFASAVNNTRSDKLDSPMWRKAFAERRCVIPVSGWYEYSGPPGRKQAHDFRAGDGSLLWAAGIWEENASLGRCYSMIMTGANAFVSKIHDRMPVLLEGEGLEEYLAGRMKRFPSAEVELSVADAVNPLKRPREEEQGELF